MITYRRAAELCEEAYRVPASLEAEDCHVALAEQDGIIIAAFRGSASLLDWWVDFQVFGHTSFEHGALGLVHAGFLNDALAIVPLLRPVIGAKPWMAVGHSKGAAEATLAAALLTAQGKPPVALTVFGCPKIAGPGNVLLAALLTPYPCMSFHDRGDPVPTVPEPFEHRVALTQLGPASEWPMITDHYMRSYQSDLTLMAAA